MDRTAPTVAPAHVADVRGIRLAYTQHGEGRPLLALHGGMGVDATPLRVPGLLDLGHSGLDLVIPDQRGHGASSHRPPYTHAAWAADACTLADHFGWPQFALLGHSYGGFIALETAVRWPHRIAHLVLVGTSAGPVPVPAHTLDTPAALRDRLAAAWPGFFAGADKHWPLFDRLGLSLGPYNAAFGRCLPRYDLRDQMARLPVPALLVVGEADPYRSAMEHLATLMPRAQLEVMPLVGHFPFLEAPRRFQSLVRSFLEAT